MRNSVITFFLFAILEIANAQNTSLPILGGSNSANRAGGTVNEEKKAVAFKIYQRLIEARGDYRYQPPEFLFSSERADCAKMDYDSLEITLEEAAYDVCAGFGKDRDKALAILLAHELVHFYEKHGWRKSFAKEYKKLDIGMKLSDMQDAVAQETEADYLGGFLVYTAGFGLFEGAPKLIEKLYKEYQLSDTLPRYASRQDREKMSALTLKKITLLTDAFEMANILTAIGKYAEARLFYEYVIREYQSRELYNNMGVMILLEVIDNENSKWFLPVELDLESHSGRGSSGFANRREAMLREAIKNFQSAINLDLNYAPAYLNLACAYTLLEDYARARFYAEIEVSSLAKKSSNSKTLSDANVLLGIISAMQNDKVNAQKLLETEAPNNPLAAKNLKILLNKEEETPTSGPMVGRPAVEKIDNIDLSDFEENLKWEDSLTLKVVHNKLTLFQHNLPSKHSKIYIFYNALGDTEQQSYFHITKDGYEGTTGKEGIKLGSKRADILHAYSSPSKVIQTPRGEILVYKKLIFMLNAQGVLERWVNYKLP